MAKTVLVTTSSFGAQDPGPKAALKEAGFEVQVNSFRRKLTEPEVLDLLSRHRPLGMIAGVEPLTEQVLKAASSHLKIISRCGVGTDNVDLEAAERLGIQVLTTPDAPSQAVAELAVALMLAVLRRVCEADRAMRRAEWKPLMGRLLGSRTVGIVGLGRIGAKVAGLVQAFGAKVLGYDPREDLTEIPGLNRVSFDELIRNSDIVTLHVPMSQANHHLVDGPRLAAMRPGSILINTSRGGLVDEKVLVQILKTGKLSGAGIDVFEEEPYQGPLKELPNVVLTSHMGSAAEECRARMEKEAAENLIQGLRGLGVI